MLTQYTNEFGAITLDEGLAMQLFAEAIKPWEGKAKYVGEKEVLIGEDGFFAAVSLSIRIGSSIREICRSIIEYVAAEVEKTMEVKIDDIIINVVQMTTSRTAVKRDIRISYRGGEDEENQ